MFEQFLKLTDSGLYSPVAECFIDAWRPVDKVLVTHAHSDHARWGHGAYFAAAEGVGLLTERLEPEAVINPISYGKPFRSGDAWVSFHPAGHILGSAQVRIEYNNRCVVVSGDFKRDADATCMPFEPQQCDLFVTEATFALPVYAWPPFESVMASVSEWWQSNARAGKTSILFCYALGKAQRVLNGLLPHIHTCPLPYVFAHSSVILLNRHYQSCGVPLCEVQALTDVQDVDLSQALVLAPPSCQHNGWLKRFANHSTAFASGWMTLRAARKQRGVDMGFVISDHADWPSLLNTIADTGAKHVWATHGRTDVLVRYLKDKGIEAESLTAVFERDET